LSKAVEAVDAAEFILEAGAKIGSHAIGTYKEEFRPGPVAAYMKGTDFGKLLKQTPNLARRINRLHLTPQECDFICSTHHTVAAYIQDGRKTKRIGDVCFFLQTLASAFVPLLIGMVGQFKSDGVNTVIQGIAIAFSVVGTIAKALEDAYHFRALGLKIRDYTDRFLDEFASFEALSGESFNGNSYAMYSKHSGAAFKEFAESSVLLTKACRHGLAEVDKQSAKK